MSSKRKHKTLTLQDKLDIIKKLENGGTMCKLAKEYGVGRATIHDLKKRKQKIEDHVNSMETGPGKRRTIKVGKCPKMENALYKWFIERRSKHIVVPGEMLKEKALEIYKKITNKDDFRASDGWLDKFKKRFGIRLSYLSSEMLASYDSSVQPFVQIVKEERKKEEVRENAEVAGVTENEEVEDVIEYDEDEILREIEEIEELIIPDLIFDKY